MPLSPKGHLLLRVAIPRLGDMADLPQTRKYMLVQRGSQNWETKVPLMKEQEKATGK